MTCNCTLAPEGCKTCPNIKLGEWQIENNWDPWSDSISITTSSNKMKYYDPKTHDLVEKPEAKKIRIEKELELNNSRIENSEATLENTGAIIKKLKAQKKELLKELEE